MAEHFPPSIARRDADTLVRLSEAGWLPVVVWEPEEPERAAPKIAEMDRVRRQLMGLKPA